MAQHPTRPAPEERRANLTFAAVIAAVVILGIILVVLNTAQQDRLATVRQTQVTGQKSATGQRTDQTQLTCALWVMLRGDADRKVPGSVRQAADKICATIPTPTPAKTGS
ncbi:hypothetical protein [Streptomyces sp. NPDC059916]|uniref:hypothetical protein n=1 Tax=Streptomyces sp. NPDC059916 TaxID=3347001 RepID=UPI0036A1FE7D